MGIKITSVSEALENNGLKILVHGMAGSGKTVLCATTGKPTLIVSAESGLLSIAGAPDFIKTTVVKTISELEEVYDYVEENIEDFEWVCIDSISEIAEVLLADEKKNSKDPRQAYGNLSDRMLGILRSFRDLPNMNVLMSCKQQLVVDPDTNISRYIPLLPGKSLTNSIAYLFDEVFALRVEKDDEGEDYRTIQTGRDRNYEAKDRSGLLDMFESPSIRKIAEKIRDGEDEDDKEVDVSQKDIDNAVEIGDEEYKEAEEEVGETEYLQSTKENKKRLQESIDQVEENTNSEIEESDEEVPEEDEPEEERSSLDIYNDSDKTMYLYHNASDAILKLDPQDSITDDGNIDVVDYKTYMGHKKRLKKEKAERGE